MPVDNFVDKLWKVVDILNIKIIGVGKLKEKYFKIKECLSRCGNSVFEINSKEEARKVISSFLNTRKEINLRNFKKEDKNY